LPEKQSDFEVLIKRQIIPKMADHDCLRNQEKALLSLQ